METKTNDTVRVFHDPGDEQIAKEIAATVEEALQLTRELWGLTPPADCRIYVMTSWLGFFFRSAPWPWRLLLGATVPFWYGRARRTWPYSAAWTQRYGRRVAIGVKPPRLLEESDHRAGARVFVEEDDAQVKVQHVTCHELVHACSAHLRLPVWLNEGIAVVTVDRMLGKQTIRKETLSLLRDFEPKAPPPTYRQLSRMDLDAIAYHAVRGYWIVRHLEAIHPGLVRGLLAKRQASVAIESAVAAELGLAPTRFWQEIDRFVADYFEAR
jgi:hypothetical protein